MNNTESLYYLLLIIPLMEGIMQLLGTTYQNSVKYFTEGNGNLTKLGAVVSAWQGNQVCCHTCLLQ